MKLIFGIVLTLSILTILPISRASQDQKPISSVTTPDVADTTSKEIAVDADDKDAYHYEKIVASYNGDQALIDGRVAQFKLQDAEIKEKVQHQGILTAEMIVLRKKMYEDRKLSPEQYDLNGDADHPPKFVLKVKQ